MKTYKIKSQKDLEKFKDEYGYYINGNAEFEYSAEFPGRLLVGGYLYIGAGSYIEAGGYIKAGESIEAGSSIEAGGYIEAGGSIEAGTYIEAGSSIEAGGYIKAGESIEAGGYIKAGESIEAGGYIEAGGSIEAGESIEAGTFSGITAGLQITCKGTLSFGLKAYAGICAWRAISDEEKIITCSKLVGGGVVEYGILRETGEVIENDVTEEAIKLLKDKGYKIVKETK